MLDSSPSLAPGSIFSRSRAPAVRSGGGGCGPGARVPAACGGAGAVQVAIGDDGAVVGAFGAVVVGVEVLDEGGAGGPHEDGPGGGVAVGGAVAGAVRRGPGERFQVGPVHGQRPAGVLEFPGDGSFEQVVADCLQFRGGQAVGLVLADGGGNQAAGVLGLPEGQLVRAVLPVRPHAQPPLVGLGQAGQRLVNKGEVSGPSVG